MGAVKSISSVVAETKNETIGINVLKKGDANMAFLQANFISKSLMRTVTVNVLLPADKINLPGEPEPECAPYKTLYLLHGILGNYTDWLNGTNIQRWSDEKNVAVVMPSGENMFYLDQEKSHAMYGEFIGKELVDMTRKMFPLSDKREDTFIAGLSMGGYGALRNGLKYHETFGYIGALSSALVIDELEKRTDESLLFMETKSYAEAIFGDLSKVKESDKNPEWLALKLKEEGKELPKIYMACGVDDSLMEANKKFYNTLKSAGIDIVFEEGPGSHEWDFWNRYIKKVLDWLPLSDGLAGMNSGKVGI